LEIELDKNTKFEKSFRLESDNNRNSREEEIPENHGAENETMLKENEVDNGRDTPLAEEPPFEAATPESTNGGGTEMELFDATTVDRLEEACRVFPIIKACKLNSFLLVFITTY
jgi:hypothetical protein